MNLRNQSTRMTLGLALVLVLAQSPAVSAAGPETMASMSALSGEVAWSLSAPVERVALRVAGPNTDHEERFAGGDAIAFSLFDEAGNLLPDGLYNWELREEMEPVNSRVRDPRNGRDLERHDRTDRVELTGRVQSGTFRVHNGAIVDPSLIEVRKPRQPKAD